MNLNRIALSLIGIASLTGAALGQAGAAQAMQATEEQRLDSIWYATTNRISQQVELWYSHGEFLRCIQLLKFETTIFPYDFDNAGLLGWFQESTDDEPGALATYIAFRNANPNDPDGAYMEAMYYYRKRVYAKVPPLLEPLVKMSPHPHANIYRELATSYERLNLLADSKRVWQMYLAVDPSNDAAKRNLDRVLKKISGQMPMTPPAKPKRKS